MFGGSCSPKEVVDGLGVETPVCGRRCGVWTGPPPTSRGSGRPEGAKYAPTLVQAMPILGHRSVHMLSWLGAREACAPILGPARAWPGPT